MSSLRGVNGVFNEDIEEEQTWVEEHITNRCSFLVNLERMTAENDTLGNYSGGVGVEERSICHELWG